MTEELKKLCIEFYKEFERFNPELANLVNDKNVYNSDEIITKFESAGYTLQEIHVIFAGNAILQLL